VNISAEDLQAFLTEPMNSKHGFTNGFVVYEPSWLAQVMATVVSPSDTRGNDGILQVDTLTREVWATVPAPVQAQLMGLLEALQIIHRMPQGLSSP